MIVVSQQYSKILSIQLLPSYIRRLQAAKRCALTNAAVTLFKSVV